MFLLLLDNDRANGECGLNFLTIQGSMGYDMACSSMLV
jgi:hypothetical protein